MLEIVTAAPGLEEVDNPCTNFLFTLTFFLFLFLNGVVYVLYETPVIISIDTVHGAIFLLGETLQVL